MLAVARHRICAGAVSPQPAIAVVVRNMQQRVVPSNRRPVDTLPDTRPLTKPTVGRATSKLSGWTVPEGRQAKKKKQINKNVIPHYQIKGVFAPKTRNYDLTKAPANDLKDVENVIRQEFPRRSRKNGMMDIQGFIRMMFEERIVSASRFHITDVLNILMQHQYSNQYLNTKVTYGVPEHQKMSLEKAITWAQRVKYHDIKLKEAEEQEAMRAEVLAAKEAKLKSEGATSNATA